MDSPPTWMVYASFGLSVVAILIALGTLIVAYVSHKESLPKLRIRYSFDWHKNTVPRALKADGRPNVTADLLLHIKVTNSKQGAVEVEGFRLRLPPYGALESMYLDQQYGYEDNPSLPYELKGKTSRMWCYNLSAQADAESAHAYRRRRCRYEIIDGLLWTITEPWSAIIVLTGDGKRSKLGITKGYSYFRYALDPIFDKGVTENDRKMHAEWEEQKRQS